MSSVAVLAAGALAATFAWASLAKLVRPSRWRASLGEYRLGPAERLAQIGVPLVEIAIPIVFVAAGPRATALLALPLLAVFSLATARAARLGGARLPCACFGGQARRDYRFLLARNAALVVLGALALAGGASEPGFRVVEAPEGGEVLAATLLAAGIALALWTAREAASLLRR